MRRTNKKNRFTRRLFIFGIIFFILTTAIFILKDYIPISLTGSTNLVSPRVNDDKLLVFKKELVKNKIQYESITQASTSAILIVKFDKDSFAYLNVQEDPSSQIKIISEILMKTAIENPAKKIKYIDLRFKKAVVKYK